jgi:hypothetical protein
MRAVDQWAAIQEGLPEEWSEARLAFEPEGDVSEAAAILAPLGPGRTNGELRILLSRTGSGPERLRNALGRLDERRVWGTLRLVDTKAGAAARPAEAAEATHEPPLPDAWDALAGTFAPDWSDVLCELDLDSSDHLPRAALLGAPLNPTRNPSAVALRFRASGARGYGASPGMVRRCLERMAAEGITGRISLVIELSDADKAHTQGPVWRVSGRSV